MFLEPKLYDSSKSILHEKYLSYKESLNIVPFSTNFQTLQVISCFVLLVLHELVHYFKEMWPRNTHFLILLIPSSSKRKGFFSRTAVRESDSQY